jgi:hypothetical protein
MSSVFSIPLGAVWVSNGQAEAILEGCIELAARRGLSGIVVDYLREKLTTSGLGCKPAVRASQVRVWPFGGETFAAAALLSHYLSP